MKVNYEERDRLTPNIDIFNDFANLQALNRELGKTNVKLAGDLLSLQTQIKDVTEFPIYISRDIGDLPLKQALKILTEEHIESGNICHQTIIDLTKALGILLNKN